MEKLVDYLESTNQSDSRHVILSNVDIDSLVGLGSYPHIEFLEIVQSNIFDNEYSHLKSLSKLKELRLDNLNLKNISFLSELQELEFLSICNNNISDLTPLNSLVKLVELHLNNNNIIDITSLKNLHNLRELWLCNNSISDISPLKELKLQFLWLDNNDIKYTTFMNDNFSKVVMYDDYVTSISDDDHIEFNSKEIEEAIRYKIKKVGHIYKNDLLNIESLDLSNKGITSLDGLQYLKNLRKLVLSRNNISDLSEIEDFDKLEYLDLGYNQVEDIYPITKCNNIRSLLLNDNQISKINGISNLLKLEQLDITNNKIEITENPLRRIIFKDVELNRFFKKYSPIDYLRYIDILDIKSLSIPGCEIQNLSGLEEFTNLEYLDISKNRICDLSPLRNLKDLRTLKVNNNLIRNISCLRDLTNLTSLDISMNKLSSLLPLKEMRNLKVLDVSTNIIENLEPITNLNVEILNVSNNSISNVDTIYSLKKLSELIIKNNKISYDDDLINPMQVIEIKDEWLNQRLLEICNVEHLNVLEASKITNLDLTGSEITNIKTLDGLENFKRLKKVKLSKHSFESIKVFKDMKKLEYLEIHNSREIEDINILNNITSLQNVKINSNKNLLDNVTSLFKDKNLKELIKNSVFKELGLIDINLDLKELKLTPLNLMLINDLNLENKGIKNISGIEYLTKLSRLDLSNNSIKDATLLGELKNINYIKLDNNEVERVEWIGTLPNLIEINLRKNPINMKSVENLINYETSCTNLEKVLVDKKDISDLFTTILIKC